MRARAARGSSTACHETALLATIAAGLGLAFVFGLFATRLRLPPILALVRRLNPAVRVIARTHSDGERAYLEGHGAATALVGERELAVSLARPALHGVGLAPDMAAVAGRTLHAAGA